MITIDRLRYFIEAARLEHVGRAAQKLNISASVVSNAILTLENELNCQLFVRENNRMKLSELGSVFLEKATQITNEVDQLPGFMNEETLPIKGHYRLGGSHFLVNDSLIPSFLGIHKTCPQVTAEFLPLDTGAVIYNLLRGQLDMGLVFTSNLIDDLDVTLLKEDRFVVVVRKGHPLLKKNNQLSLLNDFPAIAFRPTLGGQFPVTHKALKTQNVIPKVSYFYTDDVTAIALLKGTDGWAFIPESIANRNRDSISKINLPKSWDAPVSIAILHRKDRVRDRFLKLFAQALIDV